MGSKISKHCPSQHFTHYTPTIPLHFTVTYYSPTLNLLHCTPTTALRATVYTHITASTTPLHFAAQHTLHCTNFIIPPLLRCVVKSPTLHFTSTALHCISLHITSTALHCILNCNLPSYYHCLPLHFTDTALNCILLHITSTAVHQHGTPLHIQVGSPLHCTSSTPLHSAVYYTIFHYTPLHAAAYLTRLGVHKTLHHCTALHCTAFSPQGSSTCKHLH